MVPTQMEPLINPLGALTWFSPPTNVHWVSRAYAEYCGYNKEQDISPWQPFAVYQNKQNTPSDSSSIIKIKHWWPNLYQSLFFLVAFHWACRPTTYLRRLLKCICVHIYVYLCAYTMFKLVDHNFISKSKVNCLLKKLLWNFAKDLC